jgi:GeoRSP system SPASM domain protein
MELANPITIYWDLPAGTACIDSLLRISDDIVACRPLMLHLRDPGPMMGNGTVTVLERLKGEAIAVTLTIPHTALDYTTRKLLRDAGPKEILLAVKHVAALLDGVEEQQYFSPQEGDRDGDAVDPGALIPVIGVSFVVTKENWRELPTLVIFCREQGIDRVVLPMQRLCNGEVPFSLNSHEQRVLADALAAAGGMAGMALTIHDPFLWRAFNPGVPFPQGGCQAANTMLAIAPDGAVYPCPSLPVRLGELGQISLKEIAASSAKKELRRRLVAIPDGCRDCTALAECRGGCRGRAFVVYGSLDGADEACA